ncbi:MAG: hypothetical protein HQ536_04205 [Parcubacteria group bacterium]|nr:hypothetical protein [Parcubacteria group bacterium]
MEIEWKNNRIKRSVEKFARGSREALKTMIQIESSGDFNDLPGNAHFLKGTSSGFFSIDLISRGNGKRLICEPSGNYEKIGGNYKKETIKELKILEIKDTHKK